MILYTTRCVSEQQYMYKSKLITNRASGGMALVAVLWIGIILVLIVTMVAREVKLSTRISHSSALNVRYKWACRGGIELAMSRLCSDDSQWDSLSDKWCEDEDYPEKMDMDGCVLMVNIEDESAKLNINTINRKQLMALPDMTEELADSIIDWRDKDSLSVAGGFENDYYESLEYPYLVRNGEFKTLKEMLLVEGIATDLLYGKDINCDGHLDNSENLIGDDNSQDDVNGLQCGWSDYLTCSTYDSPYDRNGADKVDINSADKDTLVKELKITSEQAKWIVSNRNSKYTSTGDLLTKKKEEAGNKSDGKGKGHNTGQLKNYSSKGNSGNNDNKSKSQGKKLDVKSYAKIADSITVGEVSAANGKVNVNTASREVLCVLLEDDDVLAGNIIISRKMKSVGFESLTDLLEVEGMTNKIFKKIASQVSVQSQIFRIKTIAMGTGSLMTTVIVDRSKRPCEIIDFRQY